MAKSLRSKWKRKMRAVKRERYGVKELAKLNLIVEAAKNPTPESSDDVQMANDHQSLVKVLPKWRPSRMARRKDIFGPKVDAKSSEPMDTDGKVANKSARFPVWMSSHRRKKIVMKSKLENKKKKKEEKKALKKRR